MSIVNQLLKDLEKRTEKNNQSMKINALPFSYSAQQIQKFRRMLFLLLLIAGVILTIDLAIIMENSFKTAGAQKISLPYLPVKTEKLSTAGGSIRVDLSGMTVAMQGAVTQMRFLLSKPTLYRMDANPDGTMIRVILDHTRPKADIPQLNYAGTAVRSLSMSTLPDGDLEVLLFLQKGAKLQQAGIFPGQSPEFLVSLTYSPPAPILMNTATRAAPPVLSEPKHNSDFSAGSLKMAMNLVSAGEINKAGSLLKNLLDITPGYHPAREALIQLLMQHGRMTEAGSVLRTGLDRYPQWLPYVDLEARWLAEQGKIRSALHLLSQQSPALDTHPEYYALMAALYQRQNQPHMAATLYQQLIALQPDRARWWLGYAIALDGLDKHAEAVSAYMRAIRVSGERLSPELKAWAETRLHSG